MKKKKISQAGVVALVAAAAAFAIAQTLFLWNLHRAFAAVEASGLPCPTFAGIPLGAYGGGAIALLLLLCFVSYAVWRKKDRITADKSEEMDNFERISRELFDRLDSGIVVLDRDYRVVVFNSAAERILDLKPGFLRKGTVWSDLVNPVLVPVAERLADSLDRGVAFSREFRVFLPQGVRCVKVDLATFETPRSGIIYPMYLTDNTREDEIKQKLVQQLEETHRHAVAKDNFFANMSHEIRTPINAILGMTYFAKNHASDPKAIEFIQKIENASDILLGIVNDILDFSKMKEHKFSLNPETFNLYGMKKILADLFIDKAARKGLEFTIDFACPEDFYVFADQFRLTQIFMNLVSNAIKFTDTGLVHVSANVETLSEEVILRCAVRDTGCGLDEDELSRLFTDFEQFGKVLVKNQEGTGLGLAIAKRLVELMHGVIWVDSTPGKGSIFHFVVVLKRSGATSPVTSDNTLPRVELKTRRVLVVEDNEINAEIAGNLLAESGCTVEFAQDGVEAVELCKTRSPDYFDLVLMDIHMPRMNGYEAARIIKRDLGVICPILAVTATSDNAEELESNRDVIANYLLKPYNPGVFKTIFGMADR